MKYEDLTKQTVQEKVFKNVYPSEYQEIITKFPSDISWREKLYMYLNDMQEVPLCKECGINKAKFNHIFRKGFAPFCCASCANKWVNRHQAEFKIAKYGVASYNNREKCLQTVRERYGVDNVFQNEQIKEKSKETNRQKYGVDYAGQSQKIIEKRIQNSLAKYGVKHPNALPEVQEKKKQTCLKKYGTEHPNQSDAIRQKIQNTCLKKYGVHSTTLVPEIREKGLQTIKERYGVDNISQNAENKIKVKNTAAIHLKERYPEIIDVNGDQLLCSCIDANCNKCNNKQFVIPKHLFFTRQYQNIDICLIRTPIDAQKDTSIELFVRDFLDTIGIEYVTNTRDIIKPYEIDIYIPSKNIAIECNGVYYHSVGLRDKDYHSKKFHLCIDRDIELLSFWDDQFTNKPNIIKSIIASKLGIYEHKVGARQCQIKSIESVEAFDFEMNYHLQGPINSSIRYGLYYDNELVSIMTFGKRRMGKGWELHRYCVKSGWLIIGGASKLFHQFLKDNDINEVISFSSNDISTGELYKKLGFEKQGETLSYWYYKNKQRYHRYGMQKKNLIRTEEDKDKTEQELAYEQGYLKFYDCGQTKWLYKKETLN